MFCPALVEGLGPSASGGKVFLLLFFQKKRVFLALVSDVVTPPSGSPREERGEGSGGSGGARLSARSRRPGRRP